MPLRVHASALKHGRCIEEISHAVDMALYEGEIEPDNDPPKILFVGPDGAGNLLEVVGGEMADGVLLMSHADRCRSHYLELLPKSGG